MKLPARFIRGQTLTADRLNDFIEAIRRVRPLPGAGISVRESPDGTFISAATQKQSPATPFDHRFKVSFAKNKDGGYDLAIRKGSLWRVTDGVAAEQTLTLGESLAEHPTDADAWQVAAATAGSLYVSQSTADDGETPVYTLDYAAAPESPAAVIADFSPSQSSSNPAPKLTQRHLGDLILFTDAGAGGETPAAWMVRRHAFTETNTSGEEITTHKWQVFSPLWAVGRQTLLPDGMARGWNDLPEDADSGTLYAALTWTGTATANADGTETVSWAPGKPILTNSLADIPPDDDPTTEDTGSSTIEGKPGHRSVIVEIGDFDDAENADDEDAPATDFRQAHLGVIVENLAQGASSGGLPAEALALGPLTEVTDAAGTRYVRYLGTWKVVDGTPTFVRATGEDGAALPPAETLTPTFVQLLFRQTTASGSSGYEEATGIGYVRVPVFFPGQFMDWMTRQTATLQDRLAYAAPLSETDTGSVSAASTKLSYFSDEAPTPGPAEELFPGAGRRGERGRALQHRRRGELRWATSARRSKAPAPPSRTSPAPSTTRTSSAGFTTRRAGKTARRGACPPSRPKAPQARTSPPSTTASPSGTTPQRSS